MFVFKLKVGNYNSTFYSKKPDFCSAVWELLCILNIKFKGISFKINEIIQK